MKYIYWIKTGLACCLLATIVSCGPQGRIKADDEGTLVGSQSAGADIYNRLIDETLKKLIDQTKGTVAGKKVVCFVDMENKGAEELGANKDAIYEQIDTILVESRVYTSVSRRFVEAALRSTGLYPGDIFLGPGRKKFMKVLGSQGITPDYLLWGTVTNLSTFGAQLNEREYMLTMEMVDAHTGLTEAKKSFKMRKEYKK